MKKYSAYKYSGVDWLERIPTAWDLEKLKFHGDIQFSNVDKVSELLESPILLCNYVDVYKNEKIHSGIEFMQATANDNEIKKFKIKKGDVIITKDSESVDDIAVPALVIEDFQNVLCGYHLAQIKAQKKLTGEYLFRLFQSKDFNQNFESSANGMTRYGLSVYTIKNVFTPIPPLSEQNSIVRFLDHKTGQIDRFVANRQKQIELLKEQKAGIINNAVTKGLNPNVTMKPSEIEWVGEIPEHWRKLRLKNLTKRITNGFVGPTNNILKETGVRYIQALHVKQNTIIFNEPYYVDENWSREHPRSILRAGDIVITQTGAKTGDVGLVPKEFDGCNCHALIIVKSNSRKVIPEYLLNLLTSKFGNSLLESIRTGSMHPHLNSTIVCDIYLPIPEGIIEQQSILDYIKSETSTIDTLISKFQKQIDLMQEYRIALISHAVTGKIDVRDWQPKPRNKS